MLSTPEQWWPVAAIALPCLTFFFYVLRLFFSGGAVPGWIHRQTLADLAAEKAVNEKLREAMLLAIKSDRDATEELLRTNVALLEALPKPGGGAAGGAHK